MSRPSHRDQIVAAALDTLHRQGFNGTGVQDITDAAGVPKGSFYNHFESKEALGVAAVERYWQGAEKSIRILRDEALPPLERLKRYFETLAEVTAKARYRKGCMIGNFSAELADHSPVMRARLAAIFKEWTGAIEQCVRQAQQEGKIRNESDAATVAAFLLNAWEGTVLRARVDNNRDAFEQFQKAAFTWILV